jgi:hypothetical protein
VGLTCDLARALVKHCSLLTHGTRAIPFLALREREREAVAVIPVL